jgi:monoamine oxidase
VAGSRIVAGSFRGRGARLAAAVVDDRDAIVDLAAPVLPWLETASVRALHAVDWRADPEAGGGLSVPLVGALDAPAAWRAPLGDTLFFAGDTTCTEEQSALVDGAIETGLRAAREAAEALATTDGRKEAIT